MGKNDVEVMIAMSRVAPTIDVTSILGQITVPTLGLYPTDGTIAKNGQEATLKANLPQLQLVHVPNSYHMIWVTAPAACAKHMLYFMSAHDGAVCREQ